MNIFIDEIAGKRYACSRAATLANNNKTWIDMPLFIRHVAIAPTQLAMGFGVQHSITTVTMGVCRSNHAYACEQGDYHLQRLNAQRDGQGAQFSVVAPHSSYRLALRYYLANVHGLVAIAEHDGGCHSHPFQHSLDKQGEMGLETVHDCSGSVFWVRVADGSHIRTLRLSVAGDR